MKNLVHTIASVCLLVWLIGVFSFDQRGAFHLFLGVAIVAAASRFYMEKRIVKKK